jgi:hypothetical protein
MYMLGTNDSLSARERIPAMSSASHATSATNPRDSELLEIDTREVPLTAPAGTPPELAQAFERVADALFQTAELLQAPAQSRRGFELEARKLSDVWHRARNAYGKVELVLQSASAPEGACAHQDALNTVCRVVDATGHAILRKLSSEVAIAYLKLVPRFDLASVLCRMRRQISRAGVQKLAFKRVGDITGLEIESVLKGQQPGESASSVDQYVTLDQAAAMVNRTKKTLMRYLNDPKYKKHRMPKPDVKGGEGKPHEWRWTRLRPFLEKHFNRRLPERFPSAAA